MALNELRDHGFPYPKVTTSESDADVGRRVTLTVHRGAGQLAYIGTIEIAGNRASPTASFRRELTFKPGDLYRRSELQSSQRRLYGLELFQFANIEALNPEQQAAEVPIRVTVAEGKHQRVNFGSATAPRKKGVSTASTIM
jgi:outer membrane protein assembly factor BamA